jgi:hypothetical protein
MDFIKHLNNIPAPSKEKESYLCNDYARLCSIYSGLIAQSPDGLMILEILKGDQRVKDLEGKLISCGTSASPFSVNFLAMWLVWAAHKYGADNAQVYLNEFLDAKRLSVLNVLWISGVELDKKINLCNGYKIVPIGDMPDSGSKQEYLCVSFNYGVSANAKPRAAIVRECVLSKAMSPSEGINSEEWQIVNRKLNDISFLLNALDGIYCLPYFATSSSLPTMPMGLFGGSSGAMGVYDVIGRGVTQVRECNEKELVKLIEAFDGKGKEEKERIIRILFRFSQAKRGAQLADKVLDLGISLEMALLDDNDNNEQLSLSFRLRGSWLVGVDKEERKDLYGKFRDIYNYRSQVAHGGSLYVKDVQKVHDNFEYYSFLAGKVIRKLIIDGKPDWKSLVLGGD